MILFVSMKTFKAMTVFVRQMNSPVLKLALQELIEFVRMFSQINRPKLENGLFVLYLPKLFVLGRKIGKLFYYILYLCIKLSNI